MHVGDLSGGGTGPIEWDTGEAWPIAAGVPFADIVRPPRPFRGHVWHRAGREGVVDTAAARSTQADRAPVEHWGVAVKVHDPNSNAMEKDYDVTDIERLMSKQDWRNYDDMIKWLQKEGDADRRFTPGEVRHMIDDLSRAKTSGRPLAKNPEQLFKQLKGSR